MRQESASKPDDAQTTPTPQKEPSSPGVDEVVKSPTSPMKMWGSFPDLLSVVCKDDSTNKIIVDIPIDSAPETSDKEQPMSSDINLKSSGIHDDGHADKKEEAARSSSVSSSAEEMLSIPAFSYSTSEKNVEEDIVVVEKKDPSFAFTKRPFSVPSTESLAFMDQDSGVGNDVESQESLPDTNQEGLSSPMINDLDSLPSPTPRSSSESGIYSKSTVTTWRSDSTITDDSALKSSPPLHTPVQETSSKFEESIERFENLFQARPHRDTARSSIASMPSPSKSRGLPPPVLPKNPPSSVRAVKPKDLKKRKQKSENDLMLTSASSDPSLSRTPSDSGSSFRRTNKFEEALAATKHKHFREKLEQKMQAKPSISSRRRSSSSKLRGITSPVPHSFGVNSSSTATLDNLTADDAFDVEPVFTSASTTSLHDQLRLVL